MLRIALVSALTLGAFYYWLVSGEITRPPRVADLTSSLGRVRNAVPWPGQEVKDELVAEKVRSAALETDVATLRDQLTKAAADAASKEQALRSARPQAVESDEAQAEHRRAEALAAQLATVRQNADAQVEAMQNRVNDQQTRFAELQRDNAAVHDQIAQAAVEKAAAQLDRQSLQTAAQVNAQRADIAAAQLTAFRQGSDAEIATLEQRLKEQQDRSTQQRDVATAQDQVSQAGALRSPDPERQNLQDAVQANAKRADAATAQLAALKRDSEARIDKVQRQLKDQQDRAARLERDSSATREQLAQAVALKAALEPERQTLRDAARASVQRAEKAEAQLTALQHASDDRLDGMQRQLKDLQDQSAQLRRDNAAAREQLAQDAAKKDAPDPERQALRDAAQASAKRAEISSAQMAASQQASEARIDTLQKQLKDQQDRTARLERDNSTTHDQLTQAVAKAAMPDPERQSLRDAARLNAQRAEAAVAQLATVQQASDTRVADMQQQLKSKDDRAAQLERDNASVRDQLARAAEKRASDPEQRADSAAGEVALAKQEAETRIGMLERQLADQQDRAAQLEHDAAAARERLQQTALEKAAADVARQSLQDASQASARSLEEEHRRAEGLATQLASLRQDTAAQVSALQKRLGEEQAKTARLGREKDVERDRVAEASPIVPPPVDTRAAPDSTPAPAIAAADRYRLPDGMPTRVVVRYSRDSQSARSRAVTLSQVLQAQGVEVVDFVNAPAAIATSSMTYFYKEDRASATRLADILPEFRSRLHQSTPGETFIRPGVIEIEVAA